MEEKSVSATQIKAARALINWSQDNLAEASGLSVATIRKIEIGHISPRSKTNEQIKEALEKAGIEFLDQNGVRERSDEIVTYKGLDGIVAFFDDIYLSAKKNGGDFLSVVTSEAPLIVTDHFRELADLHVDRMTKIRDTVVVRCLLTEDKEHIYCKSYSEYRFLPKSFVETIPFYVYDDRYALMDFDIDNTLKISVVKSQRTANAFRRHFYSLWDKATPLGGYVSPAGKQK